MTDETALLAANSAYYQAFLARDNEAMAALWAPDGVSCVVSQQDAPRQDLFVKVSDGRVFYGSSMSALVAAESMNKGSLSVSSSQISFKQTWPSNHVQWDWSICLLYTSRCV